MRTNFTNQQIDKISQLAKKLAAEAKPEHTVEQNMEFALLKNIGVVDAPAVISALNEGISTFHVMYQGAADRGLDEITQEYLDKAFEGKDDQMLAQLLDDFIANTASKVGMNVTPTANLTLDDRKAITAKLISDYSLTAIADLNDPLAKLNPRAFRAAGKATVKNLDVHYFSLAVYILYVRGELDSMPAGMNPQQLGVISAGAAAVANTLQYRIRSEEGKAKFKKVMKVVAAAVLVGVLLLGLACVVWFWAAIAGVLLDLIIDGALFSALVVLVAAIAMTSGCCAVAEEVIQAIAKMNQENQIGETLSEGWSKLTEYVRTKLVPDMKQYFHDLGTKGAVTVDAVQDTVSGEAEAEAVTTLAVREQAMA